MWDFLAQDHFHKTQLCYWEHFSTTVWLFDPHAAIRVCEGGMCLGAHPKWRWWIDFGTISNQASVQFKAAA